MQKCAEDVTDKCDPNVVIWQDNLGQQDILHYPVETAADTGLLFVDFGPDTEGTVRHCLLGESRWLSAQLTGVWR